MLAGQAGEEADSGQLVGRGRDVTRGSPWATLAGWGFWTAGAFVPSARDHCGPSPGGSAASSVATIVWANPVPGAQALVEREGRVLLGRRARRPRRRPLGHSGRLRRGAGASTRGAPPRAARGDRPRDRADRVPRHVDASPTTSRDVLSLTWLARAVGGEERAGDDVTELRWFARDELPPRGRARVRELRPDPVTLARAARARVARPARPGTRAACRARPARRRRRRATRGVGEPISSSVQLRSSQVIRRKPCGM